MPVVAALWLPDASEMWDLAVGLIRWPTAAEREGLHPPPRCTMVLSSPSMSQTSLPDDLIHLSSRELFGVSHLSSWISEFTGSRAAQWLAGLASSQEVIFCLSVLFICYNQVICILKPFSPELSKRANCIPWPRRIHIHIFYLLDKPHNHEATEGGRRIRLMQLQDLRSHGTWRAAGLRVSFCPMPEAESLAWDGLWLTLDA